MALSQWVARFPKAASRSSEKIGESTEIPKLNIDHFPLGIRCFEDHVADIEPRSWLLEQVH